MITAEASLGGNLRRWLLAGVAVAWVAGWMWFARYHFLDDALIHLRYADYLWERGRLTFDGVESSYGTSSLLYVLLLAPLHAVTDAPLVVKVVSCVFYLGLVALVSARAVRSAGLQRALWAGIAMAVVSPMGVRWLTDGMETSLVAIMSVALPLIVYRASASPSTPLGYAGLSLLGAALFLLRIEMGLLVVAASVCLWLRRLDTRGETLPLGLSAYRLARIALSDSGLLAGAVTCALVVYVVFGQVLPDTAVAKSAVGGRRCAAEAWLVHCVVADCRRGAIGAVGRVGGERRSRRVDGTARSASACGGKRRDRRPVPWCCRARPRGCRV